MRKIIAIAAACLMLTTAIGTTAAAAEIPILTDEDVTSGECGEKALWAFDTENGVLTISGEGTVDFKDSPPWFSHRKSITAIVVEEGITVIENDVFSLCSYARSLSLPASLEKFDPMAVMVAARLEEITIPEENPVYTSIDGILYSKDKKTLVKYPSGRTDEEFTIPEHVKTIGSMAIVVSPNLVSVIIPENVTRIEENFASCKRLENVTLPESLEYIHGMCFYSTPWLENQQKADPFVMIGDMLFNGSTCTGDVVIPDNVMEIGEYSFSYDENITSVTFNENMTGIPLLAFDSCENLTEVNFTDSISYIGDAAFAYTGIKSIVIPATISSIGQDAFCNCHDLAEITILDPDCRIYDTMSTISNENRLPNGGLATTSYDGVIRGYEGSTAQKFAEKYGYRFEVTDIVSTVKGDADGDGKTTVADMVNLQKWLMGTGELTCWENADLCRDGKLDVFDLVLLRKQLISQGAAKRFITMDEIIRLSRKGNDLDWSDFEPFVSEDISGEVHTLRYRIADQSNMTYLYVSGADMMKKPEAILIMKDSDSAPSAPDFSQGIDIRTPEFVKYLLSMDGDKYADNEVNREKSRKIGEYALAQLKSGKLVCDMVIGKGNASEVFSEELAAIWDEGIFLSCYFADEHTAVILFDGILFTERGYLVTDGEVSYEPGRTQLNDKTIDIEGAYGGVYYYTADAH